MASRKSGKQKVAGSVPERDQQTSSLAGMAAQDLPDGGRDSVETNIGKEIGRRVPKSTGGTSYPGAGVGLRGTKADFDTDTHGGRKKN